MDSFEINKIIASILLVALLIIGISKISNIIFKVDKLDSSAYKVELPDDGAEQISEKNTVKASTFHHHPEYSFSVPNLFENYESGLR